MSLIVSRPSTSTRRESGRRCVVVCGRHERIAIDAMGTANQPKPTRHPEVKLD